MNLLNCFLATTTCYPKGYQITTLKSNNYTSQTSFNFFGGLVVFFSPNLCDIKNGQLC
jgi:hypothetical protein